MVGSFQGFPKETAKFLAALKKNNDRRWFEEHKEQFKRDVMGPAQGFVLAMGEALLSISPKIIADPRTDKSIFRVHRDTRFSNDKRPYKTHLGILFWEGAGKKMECSGYYFHLEPPVIFLGAGLYMLSREQLSRYRDDVVHPKHGPALARAVAAVQKKGFDVGGSHYQRVPRGYDPHHKYADLLKHTGVFAMHETKIPPELHSSKLIPWCLKFFKDMAPVHRWMVEFTERG